MKRVLIIGCGGAGKSTLARQLGEKTGIPVVHLDKLYWRPGWQHLSREEFDVVLDGVLKQDAWIMDGNFNNTIEKRIARCDTVIYLDFSRFTCLMGVAKRILTTYGTVRPDIGDGCPERFDLDFLKWVWNFNKDKRESYYRLLNETVGIEKIVLKNRRAVTKYLNTI